MRLSLLLGLPALTVLGLLGFRLGWPPRSLWRGVLILGAALSALYLVWAGWKTLSLI